MCWVDTAALGAIGLLAFFKPQDLAWYMVLIFNVLAMLASIAAPIVRRAVLYDWCLHRADTFVNSASIVISKIGNVAICSYASLRILGG